MSARRRTWTHLGRTEMTTYKARRTIIPGSNPMGILDFRRRTTRRDPGGAPRGPCGYRAHKQERDSCGHAPGHVASVAQAFATDALLTARGVGINRDGRVILEGVDLDVRAAEIV